jgi:hypothetical protein
MPRFQAPLVHPSTVACIGIEPLCLPDKASIIIWVQPILSFTPFRKLDLEWLMICLSQYHFVRPIIKMRSCSMSQDILAHQLLATCKSVDPCLRLCFNYHMQKHEFHDHLNSCYGVVHCPCYSQAGLSL